MARHKDDKGRQSERSELGSFAGLSRQFRAVTLSAAMLACMMASCASSGQADATIEAVTENDHHYGPLDLRVDLIADSPGVDLAGEAIFQDVTLDVPAEALAGDTLAQDLALDVPAEDHPRPDAEPCTPPFLQPCPATECGQAHQLLDSSALRDYLSTLQWNEDRPWCRVGDEVQVDGSVELDVATLPQPAWCAGGLSDCKAAFRMLPPLPGVTCQDSGEPLFCTRVRLENTRFRVRPSRIALAGLQPVVIAVWDILGPCESPCAESEISCPDNTCWVHPVLHCQGCLGGDDDVCNCRDADGPVADGTSCLLVGGDVLNQGRCECGRCR